MRSLLLLLPLILASCVIEQDDRIPDDERRCVVDEDCTIIRLCEGGIGNAEAWAVSVLAVASASERLPQIGLPGVADGMGSTTCSADAAVCDENLCTLVDLPL